MREPRRVEVARAAGKSGPRGRAGPGAPGALRRGRAEGLGRPGRAREERRCFAPGLADRGPRQVLPVVEAAAGAAARAGPLAEARTPRLPSAAAQGRPARPAEPLALAVGVRRRRGRKHRAAVVVAGGEAEQVPHGVDRLGAELGGGPRTGSVPAGRAPISAAPAPRSASPKTKSPSSGRNEVDARSPAPWCAGGVPQPVQPPQHGGRVELPAGLVEGVARPVERWTGAPAPTRARRRRPAAPRSEASGERAEGHHQQRPA